MLIPLHRYTLTLPIGSNDIAIDGIAVTDNCPVNTDRINSSLICIVILADY